jgi:hypothetical protein
MFLDRSHTAFLNRERVTPEKAGVSAIRGVCEPPASIIFHFLQAISGRCHFFDGKPRLNPSQPVYFRFMTACGLARLAAIYP